MAKRNAQPFVLWLEISSFTGMSIGAEHYYGKVVSSHNRKSEQPIKETLQRKLSAKEAAALTRKDNDDLLCAYEFRYKAGQLTDRFDSMADVIEAGRVLCREKYPNAILIRAHVGSASAHFIEYAPQSFFDQKVHLNNLALRWQQIGGYEKGRDKEANKIDDEWYAVIQQYDNPDKLPKVRQRRP